MYTYRYRVNRYFSLLAAAVSPYTSLSLYYYHHYYYYILFIYYYILFIIIIPLPKHLITACDSSARRSQRVPTPCSRADPPLKPRVGITIRQARKDHAEEHSTAKLLLQVHGVARDALIRGKRRRALPPDKNVAFAEPRSKGHRKLPTFNRPSRWEGSAACDACFHGIP